MSLFEKIENISSSLFSLLPVGLRTFSPAPDLAVGYRQSESESEIEIVWGRTGNDLVTGFPPEPGNSSRQEIDILLGDLELLLPATRRDWKNRFVLGDWRQPFYVSDNPGNLGLSQFAILPDFNPNLDTIQLHGAPEEYSLVGNSIGTAIYLHEETGRSDLIALLPLVSNLSLEDSYFQFEGNTPPEQELEQVKQLGTLGYDAALNNAVDNAGNVYIVGGTTGELGGPYAGIRDAWIAKYNSDGNLLWIQQFGTSDFEWATSIATDKEGNFYLTGITEGDLAATNAGSRDVFLAKYDGDGDQQWIRQFGEELIDSSYSIDVDDDGFVYLSGLSLFEQSEEDRPGLLPDIQDDSWVTKYDSNGNRLWFTQFGTSQFFDESYGVAVDDNGSVYATGWTLGDLGGTNAGLYDAWLSKVDSDGELLWIEQLGTEDYDWSWGIDTDSEGNIYATGWTLGNLGGDNAGAFDAWVAKYNDEGQQIWIRQFGTNGDDAAHLGAIEVDSEGDIFLTGYTDGNLGGDNAGSYDAWVAKYNSEGQQIWIQQFGTMKLDYASDVSVDSDGNLYVTGFTEGSFGELNAGFVDSWVAKLDKITGALQDFSGDFEEDNLTGGTVTSNITNFGNESLDNRDLADFINTEESLTTILTESSLEMDIGIDDNLTTKDHLSDEVFGVIPAENIIISGTDNYL